MAILQITAYPGGTVYPRVKPVIQHGLSIEGSITEFSFVESGLLRVILRAGDDCWVTWYGDDPKQDGSCGDMLFMGDELTVEADKAMTVKVVQRSER